MKLKNQIIWGIPMLEDQQNKLVDEMAEREYYHLQKAAEMDRKIEAIQHSTKVDIPLLSSAHNYFRMKCPLYYAWHTNRAVNLVNYVILVLYLMFWLWVFYRSR